MRFRIAQCLCGPARHAILAMALGPATDDITDVQATSSLRAIIEALVDGRGEALKMGLPPTLNPWCGLCGRHARDWVYEIRRSKPFSDWETAQRFLKECEADQQATKLLMDAIDESFDARVRNPAGPVQ
jgi:hypothetical protein